ncbi:hypothetical protein DP148_27050 [Salmonella enterica subsp. enterica serovar Typhimurium]|nr:hypothetical protein DP148_27050 [Salmonella enterica subsp. enterica serovar Typhimurium]
MTYGIVIENNTSVYSGATKENWTKGGSGGQLMVLDESLESMVNSLLAQVGEDDKVTSGDINMFELDQARYDAVVARLQALDRYEMTDPLSYKQTLEPLTTDGVEDTTLVFKQFEGATIAKRAATSTLEEMWSATPVKKVRIEDDEDDD